MYYQIKGLVLNSNTHGEADKIATIYSYEWGKIQAIVPSAKKIAAKLSAATEPLTESEFMVFQSHTSIRPKITGAVIIKNNSVVKTDFNKNLHALYVSEIGDKFTPFNMESSEKYELISRAWKLLSDCKNPKRILTAFVLRFLKLSGYSLGDYIKNHAASADKDTEAAVMKLSRCSGDEADDISGFDDNKTWNYVENYLTNYIKRPAVSVFMRKIQKTDL
ncbi:MAG: DNA repair protein RecO [Endomicrobia bacterium]|nr:DNA repair protein RecO [Endomicrobiia bacterium]